MGSHPGASAGEGGSAAGWPSSRGAPLPWPHASCPVAHGRGLLRPQGFFRIMAARLLLHLSRRWEGAHSRQQPWGHQHAMHLGHVSLPPRQRHAKGRLQNRRILGRFPQTRGGTAPAAPGTRRPRVPAEAGSLGAAGVGHEHAMHPSHFCASDVSLAPLPPRQRYRKGRLQNRIHVNTYLGAICGGAAPAQRRRAPCPRPRAPPPRPRAPRPTPRRSPPRWAPGGKGGARR